MHPPLVKICGLTTPEDAVATAEAGADWIGLNFYPPSPRYVTPDAAAAIIRRLPPTVVPVGLFVDRSPSEVAEIAAEAGLRVVQFHGDEPPEMIAALGGLRVVKAFRLGDAQAVERMKAYLAETERLGRPPEAVLVDAFLPGLPGGTGRSVADELLDLLPPLSRLILAGGLTPENVGERVARARPWMVDVAGGVESSPGRKDPARVAAFVRNAKGTR